MSNFIKVALTEGYGTDGAPAIGGDDKWLNLDHVALIEEQIAHPAFGGHRPLVDVDEEYFPSFLLTLSTGEKWLLPLATASSSTDALAALERFASYLVRTRQASDLDAELANIHRNYENE